MLFHAKQFPWIALAGLAALAAGGHVRAQSMSNFRVPPGAIQQESAQMSVDGASRPRYSDRYAAVPSGYYGYNPGYGTGFGGFLSGAADVITSQGQLVNDLEQSKITREKRNQMRIDTRRKSFDQYLYERKLRPSTEDDRERNRLERMRRARNDPPVNEIWTGKALNDLLDAILKMHAQRIVGGTVPIDPDVLKHINVTSGSNATGSLGLLRDGGKLRWPFTLRTSAFADNRKKLDELSVKALAQAQAGEVDADTIQAMGDTRDDMEKQLRKKINSISANDYIRAKRYLNDLEGTIKVLQSPEVSHYATRKYSAQGATVYDLVQNMSGRGLRFAPAVPGDEAAYVALHRAMVDYLTLDPSRPWDPYAK